MERHEAHAHGSAEARTALVGPPLTGPREATDPVCGSASTPVTRAAEQPSTTA